jgi:predicted O-linked N-acetylglucosamine transferase (SPINDLY family)
MTIPEAFTLALQHHQAGRLQEAEALYRQILGTQPDHPDALNNLGVLMGHVGRHDLAVAYIRRAIALAPSMALYHSNLGNVCLDMGNVQEAIASYRKAVALEPTSADAHYNLGVALGYLGRVEEVVASYKQALAIRPDFPEALFNLGNAFLTQGLVGEALSSHQRALAARPADAMLHANILFNRAYLTDAPDVIARDYQAWNERHARPLGAHRKPPGNDRDPERRLRVGYVSADFRGHPVSCFLEPLLSHHDHGEVEMFCYSNAPAVDAVTPRFRTCADVWRAITGLPDEAVAELIRKDEIDILVDLSGYTAGNRLLVFARKPAPVQATYLGSLTTTAMEAMDYKLTDRLLTPPDSAEWSSEEPVRLPGCFVCYQGPVDASSVAAPPAQANGHVTFGSFNNLKKVTPAVIALWSRILLSVPGSRLILKDESLADSGQQARYARLFMDHGIGQERIELHPRTSMPEFLSVYGRVDIGLDPFPYNGCTTTCEALWMGVPVVTLAGVMSYSRFGLSLLSTLGLDELVAKTPDAYVEKAAALAGDPDRLAVLRAQLRPRMAASTLCDAKSFARGVEQAYRLMWRRWCRPA